MPRLFIAGNQKQSFSAGGGTVRLDLSKAGIQNNARLGGHHFAVQGYRISGSMHLARLAHAPAVAGLDLPACLEITLQRQAQVSSTMQFNAIPGDALIHALAKRSAGINLYRDVPSTMAADPSSGDEATKRFSFDLLFDEPYSPGPDDEVWPLVSLAKGFLDVKVNPISAIWGDNKLSFVEDTANNYIDVDLIIVSSDDPEPGQDVRWSIVKGQKDQHGDVSNLEFPAGRYKDLIYCPPRVNNGGGDDVSKLVSISSAQGGQPLQFPATMGAADYHRLWRDAGGFLSLLDTGSTLSTGKAAVIKGTIPMQGMHQELFEARKPFTVDLTTGSDLINYHRFLCRRIFSPSHEEDATIAAASGIVGPFTRLTKTAAGTSVDFDRASTLPGKLVAGTLADPKVRKAPAPAKK